MSSGCFLARINALRISGGMLGSSSGSSGFCSVSGCGSGVSDFFSLQIFSQFGNGIVISGFFVRIINILVDTYSGIAANIMAPKTKPTKPYNCECASRCHWALLKIQKPNI